MADDHCRSAHLCCRDRIAWTIKVFPPLHPVSGKHTRWHITACTVCGRQFMIGTRCRSVKFLMSCLALKIGDHGPNFKLWCLMLSVELVWYIHRSQLQPVLSVSDSDISILLHKQQHPLSAHGNYDHIFEWSTQCWLYGLRKATLPTVDPMMAASWSSSVTMVN